MQSQYQESAYKVHSRMARVKAAHVGVDHLHARRHVGSGYERVEEEPEE